MNNILDGLNGKDIAEVISAVIYVGKTGMYELKDKVLELLEHPESELRRAAVTTLANYLEIDGLRDTLFRLATTDLDPLVRLTAMRSWRNYCQRGEPATNFELVELVNLLETEEDILVCVEALCCFKTFIGEQFSNEQEKRLRSNEDWDELNSYLDIEIFRSKLSKK